jgi:predicted transglutaminase-like cysteine proteinase
MKAFAISCLAAVALLAACRLPSADAPVGAYLEPGGRTRDYRGLINAAQVDHLSKATFPRLTREEWRLLRRVNGAVNRDIRYLSDRVNYGMFDRPVTEPPVRHPLVAGMRPARYGDCEDYALTKKHRLEQSGFSASRTFVALADVPQDNGRTRHSVLAVPEGNEWWVLNNWGNGIERASSLERWWEWDFIRPRYDSYLLAMQTRRIAEEDAGAASAPGAGAPANR